MMRAFLYAVAIILAVLVIQQGWVMQRSWHYLEQETPAQAYGAAPDKAKVTIVAFVSYTARLAKDINPTLMGVVINQPDTRVVFHIIQTKSTMEHLNAQIAMAAAQQNKFIEMHEELMRNEKPLTPTTIRDIAAKIKVDPDRLLKDMQSPALREHLRQEFKTAKTLQITAAPVLVFNRSMLYVPDSLDTTYQNLMLLIETARKK